MSTERTNNDWDPEIYHRFRGLRLRPAIDLLTRIPDLPKGPIYDLGCGSGMVGGLLRHRFGRRHLIGVDSSVSMLEEAEQTEDYDVLVHTDLAHWIPDQTPALYFSNAVFHWVPNHIELFGSLMGHLPDGGVLAVQMPRQQLAPSHTFLREVAADLFPDLFNFSKWAPAVAEPTHYVHALQNLGTLDLWETEYMQTLGASDSHHPVCQFTSSTAMRPFADKLNADQLYQFLERYNALLHAEYPVQPDGSVVFPFRRMFFVIQK